MSNDLVLKRRKAQKELKKKIRQHGNTDPGRIEDKRLRLSQTVAALDYGMRGLALKQHQLKLAEKLPEDLNDAFEAAKLDLRWKAAVIEGLGAIVDCLSVQERARGETSGKIGFVRWSLAHIVGDMQSDEMGYVCDLLKKYIDPKGELEKKYEKEAKENEGKEEDLPIVPDEELSYDRPNSADKRDGDGGAGARQAP